MFEPPRRFHEHGAQEVTASRMFTESDYAPWVSATTSIPLCQALLAMTTRAGASERRQTLACWRAIY